MNRLSSVNVFQQMPMTSQKPLICEFPPFRINFVKTICIQLPDEAGEVAVLKVGGQENTGEFSGIPHNKTVASGTP